METVVGELCRNLRKNQPVVLATILSQEGSTPRNAGTKMLVLPGGDIIGTIGGGKIEAKTIQTAASLYKSHDSLIKEFSLDDNSDADVPDAICGGRMTILIEHIDPTSENLLIYQEIVSGFKKGAKCILATQFHQHNNGSISIGNRCLMREEGTLVGGSSFSKKVMETLNARTKNARTPVLCTVDEQQFLVEPFLIPDTVFIFGAGHVAKQLAILCKMVDFKTVVLDDRKEFANSVRFSTADEIVVLEDFDHALSNLNIDANSYIVIATRGHRHDKTVLEQALRTDAAYIGMVGSRKKRDAIYQNLLSQGYAQKDIDRVHCPIGLDIAAETPEEIAVSITAELVLKRALQHSRRL